MKRLLLILALAACSDSTGPATYRISGDWTALIGPAGDLGVWAGSMSEDANGDVTGTGTLGLSSGAIGTVVVTGEHTGSAVELAIEAPGFAASFTGTMSAPDRIQGTITGPGLPQAAMTFTQ